MSRTKSNAVPVVFRRARLRAVGAEMLPPAGSREEVLLPWKIEDRWNSVATTKLATGSEPLIYTAANKVATNLPEVQSHEPHFFATAGLTAARKKQSAREWVDSELNGSGPGRRVRLPRSPMPRRLHSNRAVCWRRDGNAACQSRDRVLRTMQPMLLVTVC